jgi:hypothetical protein
MSVIDKWLNIHRQNLPPATTATTATTRNTPFPVNELDVAGGLLQVATFAPDHENVARCSNRVATENPLTRQVVKDDIADVAVVAGSDFAEPESTKGRVVASADDATAGSVHDVLADELEERAAIVEYDGGVPRAWAEGYARLHPDRPPKDLPPKRWLQFINDIGRFLV